MKEIKKKSKTVGIVTVYHKNYNFGGLLQAYALPVALKKYFDLEAEQIDYVDSYISDSDQNREEKLSLVMWIYQFVYRIGILFFAKLNEKRLFQRKKAFESFIQEIPHSKKEYYYTSISECSDQYDLFICGGDQIWNETGIQGGIETYTLQFVPEERKKIAYAPSMAILEASDSFRDLMKRGMKKLDAISVREKRSLPILQSFTEKTINIVVDPVLLLEKKDWDQAIRYREIPKKYAVCYLLGDNENQRRAVKQVAGKLQLSIVSFPHIFSNVVRKCDLFFGDIRDFTSGPREFLGLIKNADFVITDSFHACVFSMIFETPFAVFERHREGEKGNMNSRIYDFLEEYHLESQLVTEEKLVQMQEIPRIDYTYAHAHWKKRREESLEYLANALKDN